MAAHFLPKLPSTTTTARVSQSGSGTKHSQSHTFLKPQHSWLIGFRVNGKSTNFSLNSSYVRPHLSQRRPFATRVSSTLPTAGADSVVSTEKGPIWSWRAIKSFAMGELEARKLKYATTGTESLLMGILVEGTSLAAKFLRANGVTLLKVRDETVKLLGKGDMFFFSPEHPPLTEAAQKAINWAIGGKLKSGNGGEVTSSDLLLGIWSEVDSPGHKILAALGFNDDKAKELGSLSSEHGFVDD